jgi:nicotinamidase-related amidase
MTQAEVTPGSSGRSSGRSPPIVHEGVHQDRGPVLVTIHYDVPEESTAAFLDAVRRLGTSRRRDGAFACCSPGFAHCWCQEARQTSRTTSRRPLHTHGPFHQLTARRNSVTQSKLELLTPDNCQLIFVDHQPQMAFGVQSIDRQTLKNNVVALARSARVFNVPTIITTVETDGFSGHTYPELLDVFPDAPLLERTSMNSWDDQKVRDALAANGRRKVVVSGLWTEVCNCMFALCAMQEGDYEIYMVADASGGTSIDAHKYAMERMVQVGVVPMTWQQVLLEWQRDWARKDTYDQTIGIVQEHSGAYGMGVDYAYTMVHKANQRGSFKGTLLPPKAAT